MTNLFTFKWLGNISGYKVLLAGYDLPDKIKIWNAHFHYGAEALHAVTPCLDLVPKGTNFFGKGSTF